MGKLLRDVSPGCRVYIPHWGDGVLYEVQSMPRNMPVCDIDVISEEDGKRHALPSQTQVVICDEDDEMHEYSARCNCTDCSERRIVWESEETEA